MIDVFKAISYICILIIFVVGGVSLIGVVSDAGIYAEKTCSNLGYDTGKYLNLFDLTELYCADYVIVDGGIITK